MVPVLGDDEFICYIVHAESGSKYYIVTERRLISFKNVGWINATFVLEKSIEFSEIISFGDMQNIREDPATERGAFTVHTYGGDVEFWFDTGWKSPGKREMMEGYKFFYAFRKAYQANLVGTTVADASLMRAKL